MARFKVLVGKHAEGGRVYSAGEIVDSKTDLNKLNHPGALKFQKMEEEDEPARPRGTPRKGERQTANAQLDQLREEQGFTEEAETSFPGGQKSTGFQQAGRATEQGIAGISNPAPALAAPPPPKEAGTTAPRSPLGQPKARSKEDLEAMTVADLHELARKEEVNLHGATTKEEIVAHIHKAQKK